MKLLDLNQNIVQLVHWGFRGQCGVGVRVQESWRSRSGSLVCPGKLLSDLGPASHSLSSLSTSQHGGGHENKVEKIVVKVLR